MNSEPSVRSDLLIGLAATVGIGGLFAAAVITHHTRPELLAQVSKRIGLEVAKGAVSPPLSR
jgi:hypothetical protein